VHRPERWIFSLGRDQDPIHKATGQNLFYRSLRRSGLKKKLGIHSLRHSFATLLLENGVEITVVQKLLGHAYLATTARYLHVRQERLGQIKSPLGLLNLR
jgi:site-specific recombinase XerD